MPTGLVFRIGGGANWVMSQDNNRVCGYNVRHETDKAADTNVWYSYRGIESIDRRQIFQHIDFASDRHNICIAATHASRVRNSLSILGDQATTS